MEIVGREAQSFWDKMMKFINKLRDGKAGGYGYMAILDQLFGLDTPYSLDNDNIHMGIEGRKLLIPELLGQTGLTFEEAKRLARQHFETEMEIQIATHQAMREGQGNGCISWDYYLKEKKEQLERWDVYDLAQSAFERFQAE